jgi:hypothetical protein
MAYVFTPDDAQTIADAIVKYLRKQKCEVSFETALSDNAPYRTTLLAKRNDLIILIEAQKSPNYGGSLQGLARWLGAERKYCELYLATDADAYMQGGLLTELERDGVGLMLVDDTSTVSTSQKPRNPALVITPDPTLRFGKCKEEVRESINKFNSINRKDGLRDMCEIVEKLTEEVAVFATKKGYINRTEAQVRAMNWSEQINILAAQNVCTPSHQPLLSEGLKTDLHSFRGARNLIDHKVKTKREDEKRQKQFAERMMMGPRLVAELVSLKRQVK